MRSFLYSVCARDSHPIVSMKRETKPKTNTHHGQKINPSRRLGLTSRISRSSYQASGRQFRRALRQTECRNWSSKDCGQCNPRRRHCQHRNKSGRGWTTCKSQPSHTRRHPRTFELCLCHGNPNHQQQQRHGHQRGDVGTRPLSKTSEGSAPRCTSTQTLEGVCVLLCV